MRRSLLILLMASLVLGLAVPAGAFCIYNKTSKSMPVVQESGQELGRGYQATIASGERGCCNWSNKSCNKKGHKDSILSFSVPKAQVDNLYFCREVQVKAGGWMDIEEIGGNISCTAHY